MVLKFNDIIEKIDGSELGGSKGKVVVFLSNIDDIFGLLKQKGITEIEVDWNIMFMIARFAIANANPNSNDMNWDTIKIIKDGIIDKFFGVNLILK